MEGSNLLLALLAVSFALNLIGAIIMGRYQQAVTILRNQVDIERLKLNYYEARISLLEMKLWNAGLSDDNNDEEKYED